MTLRSRHILLSVLLAVAGYAFASDVLVKMRYEGWGDFRAFHSAAGAGLSGGSPYDLEDVNRAWRRWGAPRLKATVNHVYPYPPVSLLLFEPLVRLPFLAAARVWMLANVALWLCTVWLVARFLEMRPESPGFWLLALVALRFEPVLTTFTFGQVNVLVTFLTAAALVGLKGKRPAVCGGFLAAAISLKLTPAVLLAYLAYRRNWRPVAWTLVGLLALQGLGILASGWAAHRDYVAEVLPSLSKGFILPLNQSLTGFFLRLYPAFGLERLAPVAFVPPRAAALVFLVWTYLALRAAGRPRSGYSAAEVSLCLVLASIGSPVTWTHHLVWMLLPFGVLFRHCAEPRLKPLDSAAVVVCLLVIGVLDDYYVHPVFRSGLLVLVSSVKLYALIGLFFLLRRQVRTRTERESPVGGPVTVCYVSETPRLGGGEVSLLTLVEGLDRRRFRPVAVCYGSGDLPDRLSGLQVPCHILRRGPRLLDLLMVWRLGRIYRRHRATIIHVNSLDIRAGVAAWLVGTPLIGHLRVIFPFSAVDRLFVRLADRVIAVSDAARDHFCVDHPDLAGRFRTVPNGVRLPGPDHAPDVRAQLGLPPATQVVCAVARIDRWKGLHAYLDAARLVRSDLEDAHFLLVGSADPADEDAVACERELRELAESPALRGHVHFLGFRTDAVGLIRQADVLVVPSVVLEVGGGRKTEAFGRVVVEGLATGTPVVASNVGGIPEILTHGESGLLVAPDAPRQTADAVLSVLRDAPLRERLRVGGRRRYAEAYTQAAHADRIQAQYDEVIARHA